MTAFKQSLILAALLGAATSAHAGYKCTSPSASGPALVTYQLGEPEKQFDFKPHDAAVILQQAAQKILLVGDVIHISTRIGSIYRFKLTDEAGAPAQLNVSKFFGLENFPGDCEHTRAGCDTNEPSSAISAKLTYQGETHELSCTTINL